VSAKHFLFCPDLLTQNQFKFKRQSPYSEIVLKDNTDDDDSFLEIQCRLYWNVMQILCF